MEKIYVVYGCTYEVYEHGNGQEGQILGVFRSQIDAENFAIKEARESLDKYEAQPWNRECWYDDQLDGRNVFAIFDNDDYRTWIDVMEVDYDDDFSVPIASIIFGTLNREGQGSEFYPLDKAFISEMDASLYMIDEAVSEMNEQGIPIRNRSINFNDAGFISRIRDGVDWQVELRMERWAIQ